MLINIYFSSCEVNFTFVRVNEPGIFWREFRKSSKIKFHEYLSSGSRVGPCGRRTHGHTDMTNLIVAFRNSKNAPKTHLYSATRWKDAEGCQG